MKRTLKFITILMLLVSLSACSVSGNDTDYQEQIDALEDRVEALEAQLKGEDEPAAAPPEESEPEPEPDSRPKDGIIVFGETVTIGDIIEFTVDSCAWEQEILPSNTSGTYSYKGDENDETYLVLRGRFTNLSGESYSIEDIHESELLINGKYNFTVRLDGEDPDGAGFSEDTKPLQTVNFVIYASVSDTAKDKMEFAEITIRMLNDPEQLGERFDTEKHGCNTYTIRLIADNFSES